MKFDKPAETNPIDRLRVVGRAHPRIDGPLKTTGKATYAYEHHDLTANPAYGAIGGSAICDARIRSLARTEAQRAPGVIASVPADNAGKLGKARITAAKGARRS